MSVFPERLKQSIDEYCKANDVSERALADELNIIQGRLRHYYERGSRPDHDTLVAIADKLGRDLNWLMGRSGASPEWPKDDMESAIMARLDDLSNKITK